jgi:hypothetical protein
MVGLNFVPVGTKGMLSERFWMSYLSIHRLHTWEMMQRTKMLFERLASEASPCWCGANGGQARHSSGYALQLNYAIFWEHGYEQCNGKRRSRGTDRQQDRDLSMVAENGYLTMTVNGQALITGNLNFRGNIC